jgi:hypothetical protein
MQRLSHQLLGRSYTSNGRRCIDTLGAHPACVGDMGLAIMTEKVSTSPVLLFLQEAR